jgi:hypothetical protein
LTADASLRELERRWRATRDPHDGALWLAGCVRSGALREEDLRLAAWAGDAAAKGAMPLAPSPIGEPDPVGLVRGLVDFAPGHAFAAMHVAAEVILGAGPIRDRWLLDLARSLGACVDQELQARRASVLAAIAEENDRRPAERREAVERGDRMSALASLQRGAPPRISSLDCSMFDFAARGALYELAVVLTADVESPASAASTLVKFAVSDYAGSRHVDARLRALLVRRALGGAA